MVLKRHSSSDPWEFCGPGCIAQTSAGKIEFTLYSECALSAEALKEFYFGPFPPPGQVIPRDRYYSLIATDGKGRKWSSDGIDPAPISSQIVKGTVFKGDIRWVDCWTTEHIEKPTRFLLAVLQDIRIPVNTYTKIEERVGPMKSRSGNLNAWCFSSNGIEFILKKQPGLLVIEATSDIGNLSNDIENRIVEALQFVLAQPVDWSFMGTYSEDKQNITVRVSSGDVLKSRFQPPIKFHRANGSQSISELFSMYLFHIIGYKANVWHPLSEEITAVRRSAGGSLEDQSLMLGVAIESILNLEFPCLADPSEDFQVGVSRLRKYIDDWEGDITLKRRVTGSLAAMLQARALDKLKALSETGSIKDYQVEDWRRIRNPAAHGYRSQELSIQDKFDLIQRVTVLFYHLIFTAIGYKGKYTDYGVHGWPEKDYPCV